MLNNTKNGFYLLHYIFNKKSKILNVLKIKLKQYSTLSRGKKNSKTVSKKQSNFQPFYFQPPVAFSMNYSDLKMERCQATSTLFIFVQ